MRQRQKSGNRFPLDAAFLPLPVDNTYPVGAAAGCDFLILFFKIKSKRSSERGPSLRQLLRDASATG
ncbi:hypothetical protein, partial [Pseudomonas sp. G5(2012)]|uniref:hypothetical protein n=1 Tax=Pseudomonas sp. G5(2012) TaxID=1268068 RepID=UPI001C47C98B